MWGIDQGNFQKTEITTLYAMSRIDKYAHCISKEIYIYV
jgi:hypothetical protein